MNRILFGDNQFFGVNHMSEDKARAQAMKFKDMESIMKVLDVAYDAGINTFMCTTHDKIAWIADKVRADKQRYKDFEFYPCMPYAHKYANAVTEIGIVGTIKRFTPEGSSVVGTLVKGASAAIRQDAEALMTMLVDSEMTMFKGLECKVIFLQNVITDLMLGLGMGDLLGGFARHCKSKYGADAGFITMNMPFCLSELEKAGVENPVICASINKIGFRMCGGLEQYEKTIAEKKFRPVAMSVLASGAIPPKDAIEYICKQPKIESIVFGASSKGNIVQTRDYIHDFDKQYRS